MTHLTTVFAVITVLYGASSLCASQQHGMVARTHLAAVDHNSGTGRAQAETSSGEKRYRCVYPKGMKNWVVKPFFEDKTKPHVMEMLCSVLEMKDSGEEPEEPDRGPPRTTCIQIWQKIKRIISNFEQYTRNVHSVCIVFVAFFVTVCSLLFEMDC